jgi:hypothetical protein
MPGQITGFGINPSGLQRAFLLSPRSCQVSLAPDFPISTSTPGYLNQGDPNWGIPSPILGNSDAIPGQAGDTILHGGCLLTAMAMAINTADPNHQKTLSPPLKSLAPFPGEFVTPASLNSFLTTSYPFLLTPPVPGVSRSGGAITSPDAVTRVASDILNPLRLALLPTVTSIQLTM